MKEQFGASSRSWQEIWCKAQTLLGWARESFREGLEVLSFIGGFSEIPTYNYWFTCTLSWGNGCHQVRPLGRYAQRTRSRLTVSRFTLIWRSCCGRGIWTRLSRRRVHGGC